MPCSMVNRASIGTTHCMSVVGVEARYSVHIFKMIRSKRTCSFCRCLQEESRSWWESSSQILAALATSWPAEDMGSVSCVHCLGRWLSRSTGMGGGVVRVVHPMKFSVFGGRNCAFSSAIACTGSECHSTVNAESRVSQGRRAWHPFSWQRSGSTQAFLPLFGSDRRVVPDCGVGTSRSPEPGCPRQLPSPLLRPFPVPAARPGSRQ